MIYQISMNGGPDATLASVQEFELDVVYPTDFLAVDVLSNGTQGVTYSSDLLSKGWAVTVTQNANLATGMCTLSFNFSTSTNNFLNGALANLLTIKFNTYLPNYLTGGVIPTATIANTITIQKTPCLTVDSSSGQCMLNPICATQLRLVVISANSYYMDDISPNPVNSDGANLKFGIANDGYTEIKIINSNGEVVAAPVQGTMKSGDWQISLPVANLASGVYNVTFDSYPYYDTKKLVVVK